MKHSHKINPNHFRVAIFGSARIKKNDPQYKQIYNLARQIARSGMDVVTGGGPGLMDAASRGHHAGRRDKDIHSIGLTIDLPREQKDGFHLDIKEEFERFSKRLDQFMALSHAFVVAPGGVGTMLEFLYTWQLMQIQHIHHIPLILLDKMWEGFVGWVEDSSLKKRLLNKEDMHVLFLAKNIKETMVVLNKAHEEFNKGSKKFCMNYKKYRIEE